MDEDKEYQQDSSNLDTKLHYMVNHLVEFLVMSRTWLKTYQEIGFNSKQINNKYFGASLGLFQTAAGQLLVLGIYNIFDSDKNYDMVSITKILDELKIGSYTFRHSSASIAAAKKLGIDFKNQEDYSNLEKMLSRIEKQRPTFSNDAELRRVKNMRDNFVSHWNYDYLSSSENILLPTDYYFQHLLDWADNFRLFIHELFFPNVYPLDVQPESDSYIMNIKKLIKTIVGEDNYQAPELYAHLKNLNGVINP